MTMTANGLAKLIEECGELLQVAGKKLAYFHTNEHPDGDRPLDLRLADEIADVMAACSFVRAHMLDIDLNRRIDRRRDEKFIRFQTWHALTDNNAHGVDSPAVNGKAD